MFVSPLKRAIMTMKNILSDEISSPFGDIEIIVEPMLREGLEIPNDIPTLSLSYFKELK